MPTKGAAKPASTSKTPATTLGKIPAEKPTKTAKRTPAGKTAARKRLARPKIPRDQIAAIFARLAEQNPEPKGELEHVNAFTLLVAVVLSAQATDAGVNKATRPLFKKADTPEKMLALGEEALRDDIKTIGLYRNKAKNVIKMAQILVDEYGGQVPSSRAALQSLPGVGRKPPNVVLNMWWKHPAQAVDPHIFRVGNRTGIAPGKTVLEVEKRLLRLVPKEFLIDAHHWLILHGRYICKARKPLCGECPIVEWCEYKKKELS